MNSALAPLLDGKHNLLQVAVERLVQGIGHTQGFDLVGRQDGGECVDRAFVFARCTPMIDASMLALVQILNHLNRVAWSQVA